MNSFSREIRMCLKTDGGSKYNTGTSLAVLWLRLRTSTAGARVRSLVRELRAHMLRGTAKTKNKNKGTTHNIVFFLAAHK